MIVIIGGGPAGFFAAISAKQTQPHLPVILLEKHQNLLRKVKISGGGRCNVTHDCLDPRELSKNYPRGGRELIGAFHRFGPGETRDWFEERVIPLKTESDGRMFPESDSSSSIVEVLRTAAHQGDVDVRTGCAVVGLRREPDLTQFRLELSNGSFLKCSKLLLATGGQTSGDSTGGLDLAKQLGHHSKDPVPSLFTFKVKDPLLEGLAGVAVSEVTIKASGNGLPRKSLLQTGPLLVTHWGVSGPSVLRLSAWGARALAEVGYQFILGMDWCPGITRNDLDACLIQWSADNGRKQVSHQPDLGLPRRLWNTFLVKHGIPLETKWAELGKKNRIQLLETLKNTQLAVSGKATNKEEFVTCGGIKLNEVEFKTMESRLVPGLFFAGEILDIDGITGGFNFQACWTTGFLAGKAMGS